MGEIENTAMKIIHVYEDFYLDKEKRKILDNLFDRFLSIVDINGQMDIYEATVALSRSHPREYAELLKALKDESLISD